MKLTRVTITGADDGIDPQDLLNLSAEFPFVEWGILRSAKRVGQARYPSLRWRLQLEKLRFEALRLAGRRIRVAWHLCGQYSREALAGDADSLGDEWFFGDRIQLNGFSSYRLPMLRVAARHADDENEFILQCQTEVALDHAAELAKLHPNVSALWDVSGGRGVLDLDRLTMIDHGGLCLGRAGGLTPDNIADVLAALQHLTRPFWVDAETGARTDDRFDLAKARLFLERSAPFVEAA